MIHDLLYWWLESGCVCNINPWRTVMYLQIYPRLSKFWRQWQSSSYNTFGRIWNLMKYLRIQLPRSTKSELRLWHKQSPRTSRWQPTTKERVTGSSPSVLRSACITMVSPCAKRSLVVASATTQQDTEWSFPRKRVIVLKVQDSNQTYQNSLAIVLFMVNFWEGLKASQNLYRSGSFGRVTSMAFQDTFATEKHLLIPLKSYQTFWMENWRWCKTLTGAID